MSRAHNIRTDHIKIDIHNPSYDHDEFAAASKIPNETLSLEMGISAGDHPPSNNGSSIIRLVCEQVRT